MDLPEAKPPATFADCEKEPIHVPERTQPHGVLLVFSEELVVRRASENAPLLLGRSLDRIVGSGIAELFDASTTGNIAAAARSPHVRQEAQYVTTTHFGDAEKRPFSIIVSRTDDDLVVELEPATGEAISFRDLYVLIRQSVARMESARSSIELCDIICDEVRRISGYDRVMVYRFDDNWNGKTIAERRADHMVSYLDLHFPATDIPAQARRLYVTNRMRQIPDIHYEPCALLPADASGRPVDLSYSSLRSVSPVHIEYLQNMGVRASMSVSILRDGKLWGLIACHHATPRFLPFEVRAACDYLSQVLSLQLASREASEAAGARIGFATKRTALLAQLAGTDDFATSMAEARAELLDLARAQGAALYLDGRLQLVGQTPTVEQTNELLAWIESENNGDDLFATTSLPQLFPAAAAYKDKAVGVLGINVSRARRSWVLWFRPEVLQTVNWAGDPRKGGELPIVEGQLQASRVPARLHPRVSFERWREAVADQSLPWTLHEIDSVRELRESIVRIVLRRAEELAAMADELQRANKELEAFSYSVSHDLRAPFRHITGFGQLLDRLPNLDETAKRYVKTIVEASRHAGHLVDSLLAFSRMSRTSLKLEKVDLRAMVDDVRAEVESAEAGGRKIEWEIGALPHLNGDRTMLRLVIRNLLSNAVKYTRNRTVAVIKVGHRTERAEDIVSVSDNGVGFDPQYGDKLFGVFQRLHRVEDFEGTGIGLANVRRIVERHGGRTWADGNVDQGATFHFALPKEKKE
jgi:chemotaxis family two-component system sensor kinase Cph1